MSVLSAAASLLKSLRWLGHGVCALEFHLEIWHQAKCVARHERRYERHKKVRELEHYLDALTKKPGALAGSTALEQCRAQGRWPASYDQFWGMLKEREGKQAGTRAMIDVLLLSRKYGRPSAASGGRGVGAGLFERRGQSPFKSRQGKKRRNPLTVKVLANSAKYFTGH